MVAHLKAMTLVALLGGVLLSNAPPGALLGRTLPEPGGIVLIAASLVAGILTIVLAGRALAYLFAAVMALPLLGPIHDFATVGFFGAALGAWAFALHLELMTFATRKRRWAAMLAGEEGSLAAYQRAYTRAFFALAAATLAGLGAACGGFALVREIAPTTFAISVEARRVEGMFGMLALALAAVAAVILIVRRPRAPEPARTTTEAAP
jgi:hypothetical protein